MILKRYKSFISGVFFATGMWIIVIGLRERLLEQFATINQYIIGLALVGLAWLIGGQK